MSQWADNQFRSFKEQQTKLCTVKVGQMWEQVLKQSQEKASEENLLNIFSQTLQVNNKCRPGHDGAVLNVCFDPTDRYVISTGTDGLAILYQLSETPKLIKKFKIAKDIQPDSFQRLQADWSPNGKYLALPGQMNLQLVKFDPDPEDMKSVYTVTHSKEISIIRWVNETLLLTAGLDKILKLWHFKNEKDIDLAWQVGFEEPIRQIKTNFSKTNIHLMDFSGVLYSTDFDLNQFKQNGGVKDSKSKYEEIYSNTKNAIQDLLQRKVRDKEMIEEAEVIDDDIQIIEDEEGIEPQQRKEKKKVKLHENDNDLNNIIDIKPQTVFLPTKTEASRGINDRKFLLQNYIGSVKATIFAQDDKTLRTVEVEFSDRNFHPMIKLEDQYRFEMAAMNYRGVVLASKGPNNRELDEDGYAEDEPSRVYFIKFQKEIEENRFLLELPNQEGAESVAIGNDWFSVATDTGCIHMFSLCGQEMSNFQLLKPLVAMAAYENLLVVAYHDSVPIYGCQIVKANIYNVEDKVLFKTIDVSFSLYSELLWLGFSEEGLLLSCDSKDAIWAYVFETDQWVKVNDGMAKKFWMFAAHEYTFFGFNLDKDFNQPDAQTAPLPENIEFTLSMTGPNDIIKKKLQEIALLELMASHERFRSKMFSMLGQSRTRNDDPLNRYSDSIWNQEKFKAHDKKIILAKVSVARQMITEKEFEKLLDFMRSSINSPSECSVGLNIIISMVEKIRNEKLLTRVREIAAQKLNHLQYKQQRFTSAQTENPFLLNDTVNLGERQPQQFGLGQGLVKKAAQNLNLNVQQTQKSTIQSENQVQQTQELSPKVETTKTSSDVKSEVIKMNPFAIKHETQISSNIFEKVDQTQENKKRKLPLSQPQYGTSNLLGKKK